MLNGIHFEPNSTCATLQVVGEGWGDDLLSSSLDIFDTSCRFYARTDDPTLFDRITQKCRTYDAIFSHTRADSSLTFLNQACGLPAEVNPDLARLIAVALTYCGETEGLFDISSGGLERLWNYHRAQRPSDREVRTALSHVGYQRIRVQGPVVCTGDPQTVIVLGGIAKGYIADGLCSLMREAGVTSGAIDLGGNLAVVGARPDGRPWRMTVVDPCEPRQALAVIECEDESAVTSGAYERYFVEDGKTYHHIIDPRTGYPAQTDVAGVTVVSASSTEADALSTSMFLMGTQRGMALASSHSGVDALVVGRDGSVRMTPGMRDRMVYLAR